MMGVRKGEFGKRRKEGRKDIFCLGKKQGRSRWDVRE